MSVKAIVQKEQTCVKNRFVALDMFCDADARNGHAEVAGVMLAVVVSGSSRACQIFSEEEG